MIKQIFAWACILAAIAALIFGLNGSLERDAMVSFSLGALALLYGFALWSAIVTKRDPQPRKIKL